MRIQYFSDLHLEFGDCEIAASNADLIVAPGDIAVGIQGLERLKQLPKPVLYVAGNHEFYGHEYFATLKALRKSAEGSNVHFMERNTLRMGDIRFLGCTLWTDLSRLLDWKQDELQKYLNDFRKIGIKQKTMGVNNFTSLHQASLEWLIRELDKPFFGKTVVVTHHAPMPRSWGNNTKTLNCYAYFTDLKEIIQTYDIAAWFHGHIHVFSDYRFADTRVLCNPRGYTPQHLVPYFDTGQTVDI